MSKYFKGLLVPFQLMCIVLMLSASAKSIVEAIDRNTDQCAEVVR